MSGEVVMKAKGDKYKSKQRKFVKPNKWGYGYVLLVSTTLCLISQIGNVYVLSTPGKKPITANYAFRETIRETRRAKTLSTYARQRGPMLVATLEDYDVLGSRGVTHLEDAFGGLISGPPRLWKRGELYAYEYQNGPPIQLKIIKMVESKKHWTNHLKNIDPCVDQSLYIGAEKVTEEKLTLMIGFLKVDCQNTVHNGFITKLESIEHGGPLMGRIYSIQSEFKVVDVGNYSTPLPVDIDIEMIEIGSILEDRGYGSVGHHFFILGCLFAPLLLWRYLYVQLCSMTVNIFLTISDKSRGASEVSNSSTRSDASEQELQRNRKEVNLTRNMSLSVVKTWRLPIQHILFIMAYLCIAATKRDDNGFIHTFIKEYGYIQPDYLLHALALISQELTSWLLAFYSTCRKDKDRSLQVRDIIYAYQYSTNYLFCLKMLNFSIGTLLVLEGLTVISQDNTWIILPLLCCGVFTCEMVMIIHTCKMKPFSSSPACAIGVLSDGCSITTRQITNFLASQDVKGINGFDRDANCIPGMEYIGSISDAIALTRFDYVWEGLNNGKGFDVQILEDSRKENSQFIKFTPVGDHQFQIIRHWLRQGKQSIALM